MYIDLSKVIMYLALIGGIYFGQVPWWVAVCVASYAYQAWYLVPFTRKMAIRRAEEAFQKRYLAALPHEIDKIDPRDVN